MLNLRPPFSARKLPRFPVVLDRPVPGSSVAGVDIIPDGKDWTWVLDRACPECGFDASRCTGGEVPALLRASAAVWQGELQRADVRVRPSSSIWSPLEYGCHVRDVCLRFDARLALILTEDDPAFENWNQDATAIDERYEAQDPDVVRSELEDAADALAGQVEAVTGHQWQRTGRRSDGARFTVDTFAAYLMHDVLHHLHDIGADRGIAATTSE